MNRMLFALCSTAAAAWLAGCCTAPCRGRYDGAAARVEPKHVIVVGFDGLAAYAVAKSPAPAIKRLRTEGAGTLRSRAVLPSASAINWHSFFTCSASEQHGYVAWNSKEPKFPAMETTPRGLYPDVFSELRRRRPAAEVGFFYEWAGLPYTIDTNACSRVERVDAGAESTKKVCDYIETAKPDFLAFCLDRPDHAGHTKGWGSPEYMANVLELDAILAQVMAAVERAGIADETVIVLFSDHGGLEKHHGGATLEEMERPSYFFGKGVKKGHECAWPGAIYDDGATVAALLGIVDPPASWIGRPRHDAFK